jgi:transcriptional regulator with XRE-family HTH domain
MTTKEIRGGQLKEGRIAQNLTIEECAERTGVSPSTWQKWEYGQTEPDSFDRLLQACKAVGISVQQFACEEDTPQLTLPERCLLRHYDKLDMHERQAVLLITKRLATKEKKD